jgi:rhodanese-related sulfurtransferase
MKVLGPAAAAQAMQSGAVYLDVRSVEEFELGHPAGAFNVPWLLRGASEPNPQFLSVVRAAFDVGRALIVGCQAGVRSREATAALAEAGFREVAEQVDGYGGRRDPFGRRLAAGWQGEGHPTATQAQPGRSYRELLGAIASGS